jgi:hypothetical protein
VKNWLRFVTGRVVKIVPLFYQGLYPFQVRVRLNGEAAPLTTYDDLRFLYCAAMGWGSDLAGRWLKTYEAPSAVLTELAEQSRRGLIWRGVCQGAWLSGRVCGGGCRHEGRGAVLGAPRAECRRDRPGLVRLICEGWLPQDPCLSPGSQSRSGRRPAVVARVAHSPVAGPWSGDGVGLRLLVCAPTAAGSAGAFLTGD